MDRRRILALALCATPLCATLVRPAYAATRVRVYRSPTCGCCTAWADHLRAHGFQVDVVDVAEPGEYRRRYGIPDALGSCHTGVVEGYALEGHVPAREVRRLLKERPRAAGLAVPAMPVGSPGMESPGRSDPYDVLLVDRRGGYTIYSSYR